MINFFFDISTQLDSIGSLGDTSDLSEDVIP